MLRAANVKKKTTKTSSDFSYIDDVITENDIILGAFQWITDFTSASEFGPYQCIRPNRNWNLAQPFSNRRKPCFH